MFMVKIQILPKNLKFIRLEMELIVIFIYLFIIYILAHIIPSGFSLQEILVFLLIVPLYPVDSAVNLALMVVSPSF